MGEERKRVKKKERRGGIEGEGCRKKGRKKKGGDRNKEVKNREAGRDAQKLIESD